MGSGAFFGANFIWTTLHDFGGTDSLRGNLTRANEIPFSAMGPSHAGKANVWGTGFTPEGIDQNPAFYEVVVEQNWRAEPIANMTDHLIERAHRRYALAARDADIADAWARLARSSYVLDQWGQDTGGVGHLRVSGERSGGGAPGPLERDERERLRGCHLGDLPEPEALRLGR